MGLRIGQTPSTLSALRNAPEFGRVRLDGRGSAAAEGVNAEQDPRGPLSRQEEPQVRVGFGEGTLSPLSAALRTIDRTVEEVRRTQPSLEEIRAQFQLRAAERRREAAEAQAANGDTEIPEESEGVEQVERRIPAPGAQARNFVSPLNEAAEVAATRLGDDAPEAEGAESRADAVNARPEADSRENAARFDVRV